MDGARYEYRSRKSDARAGEVGSTGESVLGILRLVLRLWMRLIDQEFLIFQMVVEIMGVVEVTSLCVW